MRFQTSCGVISLHTLPANLSDTSGDRMYQSAQMYLLTVFTGTTVGHNSAIWFSHVRPQLFLSYNFTDCVSEVFTATLTSPVIHVPLSPILP